MKQFTQWSYSQANCWLQCPRRAKLSYIDKVPQGPPSEALVRGSAIHKEAEDFLRGKGKDVPASLFLFSKHLIGLRKRKVNVELMWAFNRKWEPVDPYGPDRWLKVILDVHYKTGKTHTIGDWKTGKVRNEDHQKQLGLYALGAMILGAKVVHTELWYVDHGKTFKDTYEASEMGEMKAQWERIVNFMEADTIFAPKPNRLCNWCPYHGTPHCEF